MTSPAISITIELLGKPYAIKCPESERQSLEQAAKLLNQKMLEVKESGKAINLERIAIISGLNLAYQFLQMDHQKNHLTEHINQRIKQLQEKLEAAIHSPQPLELIYTAE